jgi:16S rRNA processing protein RimM
MKDLGADALLAVGEVRKAFGITGEVVVRPLTDSVDRFRSLRAVRIGREASASRPATVVSVAIEAKGVRVRLRGVEDRTAAEALRGQFLFVDRAHRARLPAGRHYVHDVVGLVVEDEGGARRGVVTEVLKLPAQDVYVIRDGDREFMLPAVREFIREIDVPAGVLRVRLIGGIADA